MTDMSSKESGVYASPLDIPYIKKVIFSLNTIGSWPHKEMGSQEWFSFFRDSKILFVYLTGYFLGGISYLNKNFTSMPFIESGRTLTTIMMCFITLVRLVTSWTKAYKNLTNDFIYKIHLFHHKDQNDFAMKVFTDGGNLLSMLSKLIHSQLYFGVLAYNLIPLFNNYRKGAFSSQKLPNTTIIYELSCYYDTPFDCTTNFNGFLVIHILNWVLSHDVGACICFYDLYIFVMAFHLFGHLKILNHNLRSFPRPKNHTWFNPEESVKIKQLLVDNMDHYRLIKEFMTNLSMGFGHTICSYYLYFQLMGCIFLVEFTQMSVEAFGTYGVITTCCFQELILMSVIFELIGTQSETIKDALYEVPWECMDTSNRKIVLINLCFVQKPMEFKALGILPIGVRTMASILKTTMSYFMLLRTST